MLFWKSFSKRWTVKITSLKKILHNFDQFPCKLYPIIDQTPQFLYPIPEQSVWKPYPSQQHIPK